MQPLAGRFLRLVLQLLARFSFWVSRGLDARAAVPAADDGEADASADRWAVGIRSDQLCSLRADTEILLSWLESDYSTQLVNMLPSSSKEVRTTYFVAWLSSAWPLYLAAQSCSAVPLHNCSLRSGFQLQASTQNEASNFHCTVQSQDSVRGAVRSAGHSIRQQADSVTDTIVADLVQQCSQVLKQLQGIMVTYRCAV